MSWKEVAKKSRWLFWVNSKIKCFQLKYGLALVARSYQAKAARGGFNYDPNRAIEEFKCRHRSLRPDTQPASIGALRIFWVGTNQSQDESGLLQALNRIADVTVFRNIDGNYGIWSGKTIDGKISTLSEIRQANDSALLIQVEQAHAVGDLDLLIGQMWASRISKEALTRVQAMGIPVINIAMDDRLPFHWSTQDGLRLGSVGLGTGVNLVLTTSSDTCLWYEVEGIPSLYWPLASDPSLFALELGKERDIDVLFIGDRYGIRAEIIAYLERNGIKVECYGNGWPNGYVNAAQNTALSARSRIILGIGTVGHCTDVFTLKLRDFDALMTGALYITHRNPDLCKIFTEGKEIEYYESPQEAASKIKYYLNHPLERERIGHNGQKKAVFEHSWDKRFVSTFRKIGILK